MTEENRYAVPESEVGEIEAVTADQLLHAHKALNRSRMGFVVFFVCLVALGYLRPEWKSLALVTMLVAIVLAHVFLGSAAARSGRSWVWYALLPVLAPILGGLIAFGVLRSKVPYADA